jgi:hypothetical protein
MSETVDDKMKLKRMAASSRDVLIVLLDSEISSKFLSDDFAAVFRSNSESLISRVETYMSQAIVAIDSDGYTLKLKEEGLSDIELDFKYSLFDQILVRTGLPVTQLL